jgi:HAD superfamily hydrolase (TIGR01509 family)
LVHRRPTFDVAAVVFDKDGVLVDTEGANLASAGEVLAAAGHPLTPGEERLVVGRHPLDYLPELLERRPPGLGDLPTLLGRQGAIYERLWRAEARLIDGALEALEAVRARGLASGMATSSDRREVEAFLARFDLAHRFDVTLTLDDVRRAKPSPEIYLAAARLLGVAPGAMLVVEDSDHGVRAAKAAGAPCVALRSRWVPAEAVRAADRVIDSLRELPDLL